MTTTTSVLAYSSSTDAGTTYLAPEYGDRATDSTAGLDWDDEYCFVCRRCTNHVGEHEDLVAAGMAEYDGGTVRKTAAYDEELARTISAAGYAAYQGGPAAYEAFCQGLERGRAA